MTQIRMSVSTEIYDTWTKAAKAMKISVAEYAKFRALGVLAEEKPLAPHTAEVREPKGGEPRPAISIGQRILEEVKRQNWERITAPHGVNRLATLLNVNRRQVHGALGSLVASKKLRRLVYGYILIEDRPQPEFYPD